jgi:hypothetical protein
MFHRIRGKLSFANIMSMTAVTLALGGTSYAAVTLPHNSVGSAQIRTSAVKNSDLGFSSVTSGKVRNGSLQSIDFAPGQIPAGPAGATGPIGATGAQGPAGEAVAYARVNADGTLDAGTPAQNKNVVQANIEHDATTGPGVYCVGGLSFAPASAAVTNDSAGAIATSNQIASVAVQRGNDLGNCDASHQQARVSMLQVNNTAAPALTDHGFYIWFEK